MFRLTKFLTLLATLFVASNYSAADAPSIAPSNEMAEQTRWVANTINTRHYLRDSIGKLDGSEIIKAYAESFDYAHMVLLQEDIEDFNFRFAQAMEGFLQKGNLYAAFEIYKKFRERVEMRTEWILERLESPFDFTVDESFIADRREAEWPVDMTSADAIWNKRLKYELLNELLSLAAEQKEEMTELSNNEMPAPAFPEGDDPEEEAFDPKKLLRLLNDPEFHAETFEEAKEKIRRRYERRRSLIRQREAAEVQEAYINSMTQLFDPHSTFLSADTLENFNSSVQNSFVGIGALLQDEEGICVIKDILPGGPAEASGLLGPGDEILGVAQGVKGEFEDVIDMQLRYIVRKIKGEKGTIVRLLIRPGKASDPSVRKDISITRGEVKLTANLATAELIHVPNDDGGETLVGVIELPSFYGNIGLGDNLTTTTADIAELLKKLIDANAEGIVLDFRTNGGGLLNEAIRVAGLFIPTGPVVQVRDKTGRVDILPDNDPRVLWDGPLAVLTSRFSASASEIVAGALQDHGRALIIGNSSTHGKGTVQEVFHMNTRPLFSFFPQLAKPSTTRPVASKITIKQFYLPAGSSTQLKGVHSDIILPSSNEFLPIGESDLPHALAWSQIPTALNTQSHSTNLINLHNDSALIASLADASKDRLQNFEEFNYLKKQITWRKERYEKKDVSLNLSQRIHKKILDEAFVKDLEETLEALKSNNYKSEEFLTQISEEQEAVSKKNKLNDPETTEADEDEEEKIFDIHLRESARIMADWIHQSKNIKHETHTVGMH